MAGFMDTIGECLQHPVSIPICVFDRTEPLGLFYTYRESHPLSHSLVFRRRGYRVFEIFLPRRGEDLEQLAAHAQGEAEPGTEGGQGLSVWVRLLLRCISGKVVSGRTLLTHSAVKLGLGLGPAVNLHY